MVAIEKLLRLVERQPKPTLLPVDGHALAKLKVLHDEAEETAHLANLLGRSGYAGMALPALAIITNALSIGGKTNAQTVWLLFVGAVAGAMLIAYRNAMKRPFERAALRNYAKDLSAILLFAGFAWGAGAFLALPVGTPMGAAVTFATLPALCIAYLLRDRSALALFLAPVTALTAAASLLQPYAGGWATAAGVIVAGALVAGGAYLYKNLAGTQSKPAMLSLP